MLKQAFDLFDIDGDGNITKKELQRVLAGVFVLSDSQWDEFIKEVDKDGNGTIEFDEFKVMMRNLTDKTGNGGRNNSGL